MADGVHIRGLREWQRALRDAEQRSPRELAEASRDAAGKVAGTARRLAVTGPHEGGGDVTPFRSSITSGSAGRVGYVAFGGERSPHAPPLEFGGTLRRHASQSRTTVRKHPAVYPAIRLERNGILRSFEAAVDRITRDL